MSSWEVRDVPFKFGMSDRTLASVSLRLQCRAVPLLEGSGAKALDELDAPIAGSEGFMIRALPVESELPMFSDYRGYLRYVPLQYTHCYIDLNTTFELYQAKFSSKTRSTINRKVRKFGEQSGGAPKWKAYRTPQEIDEFLGLARQVSKLTYQERLLDAGLPDTEEFAQEARQLASHDRVRAFLLFDGDKPVAYLYCPVEDDVLIYAYLGYDPEYSKQSVGTVLQWLALEDLFREGRFKAFDFTEGQSDHKLLFSTHQRKCANVFMLKPTLRNRLLVRAQRGMDGMSERIGSQLDRLGLKQWIKRVLVRGQRA